MGATSIRYGKGRGITEEDQWTVFGEFRALRLLRKRKYTWPDGEQVFVSTATAEVEQYTTRASRVGLTSEQFRIGSTSPHYANMPCIGALRYLAFGRRNHAARLAVDLEGFDHPLILF